LVLQKNLTKPDVLDQIKASLNGTDETWEEVTVIPFSVEPPNIRSIDSFNIIYGSTTFMLNALKSDVLRKGLFYDSNSFSIQNYTQPTLGRASVEIQRFKANKKRAPARMACKTK